jgi:protein phosphatase
MAGLTDTGLVRTRNEDAIAWDASGAWAVLADGMGGHRDGHVASTCAVQALARLLGAVDGATALHAAVQRANEAVWMQGRDAPGPRAMGTTVVAVALRADVLHYAHVGDSRLYRYRGGCLERLTEDHSLAQQLARDGVLSPEQAEAYPRRHVLTRAMGLEAQVDVTMGEDRVQVGDTYLLCSDGLSDLLPDAEIEGLLEAKGLEQGASALVDAARDRGGKDNISVILLRICNCLLRICN